MKKMMHPSLTLGARRPFLTSTEQALHRMDIVLHTAVGDLPWRPGFGCDLTSLVGETATQERIDLTESEIRRALSSHIPNAKINACKVELVTGLGDASTHREALVPIAESALVSIGTEAHLEMKVDIEIEEEDFEVGAQLDLE